MKKSMFWVTLIILGGLSCGVLFFLQEGTYYYAPWGGGASSTGCITYPGNADGSSNGSIQRIMEVTVDKITVTTTTFSDSACADKEADIIAISSYVTGATTPTTIISKDLSTSELTTWTSQQVNALAADVTYSSAGLTCYTDTCVTTYTFLLSTDDCTSANPEKDISFDYTACYFKDISATVYSLIYKNSFDELFFGTKEVLTDDAAADFDGSESGKRHKYILANEKYLPLN